MKAFSAIHGARINFLHVIALSDLKARETPFKPHKNGRPVSSWFPAYFRLCSPGHRRPVTDRSSGVEYQRVLGTSKAEHSDRKYLATLVPEGDLRATIALHINCKHCRLCRSASCTSTPLFSVKGSAGRGPDTALRSVCRFTALQCGRRTRYGSRR